MPATNQHALEDLWTRLDNEAARYYYHESAEWTFRQPWEKLSEHAKAVWRRAVVLKKSFQLSLEKDDG